MKALTEQKKLLDDIESLLSKMKDEIELLRNINYRYYLKHGNDIQSGFVEVPENISFSLSGKIEGEAKCNLLDYNKLGLTSNYQNIKTELTKLA